MKMYQDAAVAEVRAARKSLCDRFGNDPRRLLAHLRAEQGNYRGRVIKNWSELEPVAALREATASKKKTTMIRYGINDIRLFYENDVRFLKQF